MWQAGWTSGIHEGKLPFNNYEQICTILLIQTENLLDIWVIEYKLIAETTKLERISFWVSKTFQTTSMSEKLDVREYWLWKSRPN